MKEGRFVAYLVAQDNRRHDWTEREIALLREVSERTWAAVERARAEEALRESEKRRRLALDAAGMGSFIWYPDEDRTEADPRLLELFGLPPDAAITRAGAIADIVHPDDREQNEAAVRQACDPAGGGQHQDELRVVRPDGTVRWLVTAGRAEFAGDPPQAVRLAGVVADITDRKRAEDALRESEENYAALFGAIDEGYAVMRLVRDADGRITDLAFARINPAFDRHTGLGDVTGRTVSQLLPDFERHWIEIYTRVAETGVPERNENYVRDADRWYRVHHLLVGDIGSDLVAVVFEDITERKRREERQAFLLKLSDALRPLEGIPSRSRLPRRGCSGALRRRLVLLRGVRRGGPRGDRPRGRHPRGPALARGAPRRVRHPGTPRLPPKRADAQHAGHRHR
jgi:PAS domain S-box-containing protein